VAKPAPRRTSGPLTARRAGSRAATAPRPRTPRERRATPCLVIARALLRGGA